MKIVIVTGSLRQPSYTRSLCQTVAAALRATGHDIVFWDPAEKDVPMADPHYHHAPDKYPHPVSLDFITQCRQADGFIWATPIYHNSYSGVLKNALDLLNNDICTYKTLGLLSHGGGRTTQGVDHLRIIGRGLNLITIPTQICTAKDDYTLEDDTPQLSSELILKRVERFCTEFVTIAEATKFMVKR